MRRGKGVSGRAPPDGHFDAMRRIEGDAFTELETMLLKHGRGGDAGVAGGKHRPAAGKLDPVRAGEMKPVKTDHKEEIEHHLAAAYRDEAALRQQPSRYFFPSYAPRVPPPTVRALLEPRRRLTRDHKTRALVYVGLEFVAAAREHNQARLILSPLVKLPVLFVAQRSRRHSVGAGDLVVVRDDGVAGDVEIPGHGRTSSQHDVGAHNSSRSASGPRARTQSAVSRRPEPGRP